MRLVPHGFRSCHFSYLYMHVDRNHTFLGRSPGLFVDRGGFRNLLHSIFLVYAWDADSVGRSVDVLLLGSPPVLHIRWNRVEWDVSSIQARIASPSVNCRLKSRRPLFEVLA